MQRIMEHEVSGLGHLPLNETTTSRTRAYQRLGMSKEETSSYYENSDGFCKRRRKVRFTVTEGHRAQLTSIDNSIILNRVEPAVLGEQHPCTRVYDGGGNLKYTAHGGAKT